jgi:hypothetical protein
MDQPTIYKFKDRIIYTDKNGEPVWWQLFFNEEVGELAGRAALYDNVLLLFPWKVRAKLSLSPEKITELFAAATEWDETQQVAIRGLGGTAMYDAATGELLNPVLSPREETERGIDDEIPL